MLELKDIVKDYVAGDTTVKALKGISLDFRKSEFVSILGQSGCGKTTLLNIIGGLDHYTSGDLIINNKSTKDFNDYDWDTYRNHSIGFIFQSYNLIMHLTVAENVELALSLAGISKEERRKRAVEALTTVGLKDQINKKPNQLSGGQMQRVAIARSLVNNPDILLADEPTGALDSETSEQVMKLLKDISKDRLIIMVTHNGELAEKYSTRIIRLLDGKVVGDTKPYNHQKERKTKTNELPEEKQELLNKLTALLETDKISATDFEKYKTELLSENGLDLTQNKKLLKLLKNEKRLHHKRTSMKYGTALSLSLKNLLTKKWRTIMTSFAGSIGIIGIALILAVSNGFTGYINKMQSEALGNYPITISAISMDTNKFQNMGSNNDVDVEDVNENVIVPYNPMHQIMQYGHYNNFTSEFMSYVKEFEENSLDKNNNSKLNTIEYDYFVPLKLLSKDNNNNIKLFKNQNSTSVLQGSSSSAIYPMLNNLDFVMSQYELIYGTMPKVNDGETYSKEMLLVIGKGNKVSVQTLESLNITPTTNDKGEYNRISFEDICNKEFKLIFNDDYYIPDSANFDDITKFDKLDTTNQEKLLEAYNNAENALKISGVIRLKDDATTELLSTGVAYMPSLKDYYLQNCKQSLIARKQIANKDSYSFYDNYVLSVAEMSSILPKNGFANVEQINQFLFSAYKYKLSNDDAFELAMQQIGISSIPVSIAFYPKTFDAKDSVLNMIDEYNSTKTNDSEKIVCADTTGFLTNTLGNMVNIISYVLIAFAAISLVVSSIMIAIITYVSVLERTKEIGVLRSIGARKKDITRVFNAETFLIGLTSGVLGVAISFILTFPISAIIKAVAGGAITTSMAVMDPISSIILIAISIVLTMISGLVPAIMAANRDPVKALRSE